MVVIFVGYLFEFRDIQELCEIVKVEHRIVFAVFTEERHVLAKVHILQMIGDETAVAPLYPLTELLQYF